jgi:hypothetical protein
MSNNSLSRAMENAKETHEANEKDEQIRMYSQALKELRDLSENTEKKIVLKTEGKDGKEHKVEIAYNKNDEDKCIALVDGEKISRYQDLMDVDVNQKILSEGRKCELGKAIEPNNIGMEIGPDNAAEYLNAVKGAAIACKEPITVKIVDPKTGKTNVYEFNAKPSKLQKFGDKLAKTLQKELKMAMHRSKVKLMGAPFKEAMKEYQMG